MNDKLIILAGATGALGGRIAECLVKNKATVRAIVRRSSAQGKLERLRKLGVEIVALDFANADEMARACAGGSCVVSALSGLRETVVDAQSLLLHAAIKAGVPRFIPSDFSIDYTKLEPGKNRNLDFRREFKERIDQTSIAATTIFNGAFADMLTGQAPFILFKLKRVLYWGNADQLMDFTTMDDTAAFTAKAALDSSSPRILRIAGEQVSARDLVRIMSELSGEPYKLLRAGSLGTLETIIKIARFMSPQSEEIYPPWQGMQYMRDMYAGRGKLQPLDHTRYPGLQWTPLRAVLAER